MNVRVLYVPHCGKLSQLDRVLEPVIRSGSVFGLLGRVATFADDLDGSVVKVLIRVLICMLIPISAKCLAFALLLVSLRILPQI